MADRHDYPEPRHPQGATVGEARPVEAFPAAIKRASWGAIFAGATVALVLQLMLNLLGIAAGLGAVDLTSGGASLQDLGVGAAIWLAIATIIAFFTGGWVAGRLAGLPRMLDGLLHGVVAWAVGSFVIFYLVASGLGLIVGGAFSIVQQGAQLLGQGVTAVAPEAGRVVGEQIEGEVTVDEVRAEVYAILRQTGKEELQPENLSQRAEAAQEQTGEAAGEAARSPQQAEEEIRQAFDRLIASAGDVVEEADREAAVNVLVARTDMSEAEARQTVIEYEQAVRDATERIEETARQAGETAVQTADDAVAVVGRAALWSFIAMLVGALAAAGGGYLGAPHDLPASPAVRRE